MSEPRCSKLARHTAKQTMARRSTTALGELDQLSTADDDEPGDDASET